MFPLFLISSWIRGLCVLFTHYSLSCSNCLQFGQWRSLQASSLGFLCPFDTISLIFERCVAFWHNKPSRFTLYFLCPSFESAKAGMLFRNQDLGHRQCHFWTQFSNSLPHSYPRQVLCILPNACFPCSYIHVSPFLLSLPIYPLRSHFCQNLCTGLLAC